MLIKISDGDNMNIVFYTGYHHTMWDPTTPGLGGSETAVANIAKYLVEAGHSVNVIGDSVNRIICDGVYYCSTAEYKESKPSKHIDTLIGVNYIHFIKELEWLPRDSTYFWLHNTEHFPYHRGERMENDGDDYYSHESLDGVICVSEWQRGVVENFFPAIKGKTQAERCCART